MARAFIIRPFGEKMDSAGKKIDFNWIEKELIDPALTAAGIGGRTTGEIIDAGNIREDMFALILEADLAICDITIHNANVFYELGIRHALRKNHTVLIKGIPTKDDPPFDVLTDRYLPYDIGDPAAAKEDLVKTINATLASDRETDSPIFRLLPSLPAADLAHVQVTPLDFSEEVARASKAKEAAAGWLRLLAAEVSERRFQWPGLRLVAKAQWDRKDYPGALTSWEKIRQNEPYDIIANLALANIYEREYRRLKKPGLLEHSNQCIKRVLSNARATRSERAEALALGGRNQKTLWRLEFANIPDLGTRRDKATNRALLKSYESYREAFMEDLNHFYSGLAALQMGMIILDLANENYWEDTFASSDEAFLYKKRANEQVEALKFTAKNSLQAERYRLKGDTQRDDDQRLWADISDADLLFLIESREARVVKAYEDAVPLSKSKAFAWDAAKGQLQLFADLGIRAELATKVIETLDPQVERPEAVQKVHLIIFAGHQVDESERAERRFPADREDKARDMISAKLRQLIGPDFQTRAFASAAPGADILFHEICNELHVDSTVCLPMPKDAFARFAFGALDTWRSRYLELVSRLKDDVIELSDRESLPKWLVGADVDQWERGNRWVLEMAQTAGGEKITLLAFWDGKPIGEGLGGTSHMVQIARDCGRVDVQVIDAKELVA